VSPALAASTAGGSQPVNGQLKTMRSRHEPGTSDLSVDQYSFSIPILQYPYSLIVTERNLQVFNAGNWPPVAQWRAYRMLQR
jgi:hypothetical protein